MRNAIRLIAVFGFFAASALAADAGRIVYSTHLNDVVLQAVAVDLQGNVYVTGSDSRPGIFVAKLDSTGRLAYSIHVGGVGVPFSGAGPNTGFGIAVDLQGNAYVTGLTTGNLPTTPNAFQPNPGNGGGACLDDAFSSDAFVVKLDRRGKLVYATYLGGDCIDWGTAIAVDLRDNAYVTGLTTGIFPTTPNALNDTICIEFCAFVAKLNAGGSSLVYSTYLGSFDVDATAIAVDLLGHAYVTGNTDQGFPTTPNALEPNWPGGPLGMFQGFVAKLDTAGSSLEYGTYLGGHVGLEGFTRSTGMSVDLRGNAYVTGVTADGFPTTPNSVQPTFGGGETNAFVAKLNSTGSSLVYSTYIGSASEGADIAVDLLGNAYTIWGSFDGALDAQVAKLNRTGSSLVNFGVGSAQAAGDVKIAADYLGNVYVATLDGSVTKISIR
jgi:hypothetical protein